MRCEPRRLGRIAKMGLLVGGSLLSGCDQTNPGPPGSTKSGPESSIDRPFGAPANLKRSTPKKPARPPIPPMDGLRK